MSDEFNFNFDPLPDIPSFDMPGIEPDPEGTEPPRIEKPATELEKVMSEATEAGLADEALSSITDAQVDDAFGSITEGWEADEAVMAEAEAIAEAERVMAESEAETVALQAEREAAAKEIKDLEEQLTKRKQHLGEVNAKWFEARKHIRHYEKVKDDAEVRMNVAREAFFSRQKMSVSLEEYARIAEKFPWRVGLTGRPDLKALPHQWDGMRFLATAQRAILGDYMGVGKTLTSLGALDITGAKRVLIVSPADITTNFVNEIRMWTGHRTVVNIKGMSKHERNVALQMLDILPEFTLVVNYEAWRKDLSLLVKLANVGFDTIIMDEAHVAKDTGSVTYRGLHQIITSNNMCPRCHIIAPAKVAHAHVCPKCGWAGEALNVSARDYRQGEGWDQMYWTTKSIQRVWPMTGTPILNRPQDMYALLSLIDPVNFNSLGSFLRSYAQMDQRTGKWGFKNGGVNSLMTRLSGKFLARTMHDAGITLPPKHPIIHEVELDPIKHAKQIEVIEQLNKSAAIMLSEEKQMSIPAMIALITRQRQANVWPGGIEVTEPLLDENGKQIGKKVLWRVAEEVEDAAKLDAAYDLVHQYVDEGQRLVVFSQFSGALREFQRRLNGTKTPDGEIVRSVVFDGNTPNDIRTQIKTNFDRKLGEAPKWEVVLCNYKTGGVGLNLTAATHTIFLDKEWNPGKEDQAIARTDRIGQTEETYQHHLVIPDSIDSWMDDILASKKFMLEGFNEMADDLKEQLLNMLNSHLH